MTALATSRKFPESISRYDLWYSLLAGTTGVAGSYAVAGYTPRFIVAPIDALVVELTPGQIVAFIIQNIGEAGHLLHIALSIAIAVGVLGGGAMVGLGAGRRAGRPFLGVVYATTLAWGVTASITGEPVIAISAAGPVAVFTAVGAASFGWPDFDQSRRNALVSGMGAIAFLGVSIGLRGLTTSDSTARDGSSRDSTEPLDAEVSRLMAEADRKSLDITGDIPGLVSTFEEFYNVDTASFDPNLSADGWSLSITGAVGDDVTVTFDDLTDMPTERRFLTLRCVGEPLNGHKLDNAVWTGTPIKPLLEAVDPRGACGCAMLHAEDDYFVQFPIEALEDGFLAWGMNGEPLPKPHGHPVRVLIPGHWGETNVKWLTEIELLEEEMDGYWEQRGWHGTGPVKTVAKLWSDTMLENGNLEVAGHAYAGVRGIESVEVSIDGGESWQNAELSEPLPGVDVWRQWRFEFEPDGSHVVIVRAIDAESDVQSKEQSDSFPSGATGWVSKTT